MAGSNANSAKESVCRAFRVVSAMCLLGEHPIEEAVASAVRALEDGYYSDALRTLAYDASSSWFQVKAMIDAVARELGTEVNNPEIAVQLCALGPFRRITSEESDTESELDALALIIEDELDTCTRSSAALQDLYEVLLLRHQFDTIQYVGDPALGYWDKGDPKTNLVEDIRTRARAWLDANGTIDRCAGTSG